MSANETDDDASLAKQAAKLDIQHQHADKLDESVEQTKALADNEDQDMHESSDAVEPSSSTTDKGKEQKQAEVKAKPEKGEQEEKKDESQDQHKEEQQEQAQEKGQDEDADPVPAAQPDTETEAAASSAKDTPTSPTPPSSEPKLAPATPGPPAAKATNDKPDLPETPSTSAAQALREREALADPADVAAVAQAFRRGSPSITNSRPNSQSGGPTPFQKDLPPFPTTTEPAATADASTSTEKAAASQTSDTDDKPQDFSSNPDSSASALASEDAPGARRSSAGGINIGKGPPPTSQASEELPFDFNRFLDQMKHRSAQPVGEYVRSFIKGFAKKPYRTADQIKLIFDFLAFISDRMKECEVWASLNDAEFDNAKEAMEKLVMNRLYPYTFTPAVEKEGRWSVQTDDLERDRVLKQRIRLFSWLKEEHLDVPVGDHSRGFVEFSIQELLKINHYKAPRDKLICILNCCKVIFGMIRHLSSEENADTFIPVLIFVVLKANPDHLISNVEYISRFRNPDRLSSESGYYLSSLMGAIAFIETMDNNSLSNITQEEFERNVEQAVQTMPEPNESPLIGGTSPANSASSTPARVATPSLLATPQHAPQHGRSASNVSVTAPSAPGEEAAKALPSRPIGATLAEDTRAFFLRTGEAARVGLGRPMGALGRLINEGIEGIRTPNSGTDSDRQGSPAPVQAGPSATGFTDPAANMGGAGMTPSTSRSRLFAGLFGGAESEAAVSPSPSPAPRRSNVFDSEPQTPSTGDLTQDGFLPPPNAPQRLRPQMPARGYSIDENMYDDAQDSRRNLQGVGAGADEDDDDEQDTPNAAAVERMRRRKQMFGGVPTFEEGTPTRLRPGPAEDIEQQQTEEAIEESLVQAEEEAQQSASVETLRSIFPTMEVGVIQMVLQGCEGNVEVAIDRLLEMT